MRRQARKFVQFPPSDSLTDTQKEQKFHPPSSWGGGGLVPQVPPPPRDAPVSAVIRTSLILS